MSKFLDRTGEIITTKSGRLIKIIEYFSSKNCTIQFEDGTILKNKNINRVKKDIARNPNTPVVYGVGYTGEGKYKAIDYISSENYYRWKTMVSRGYNKKYKEKHPTYKDITVCEEWYNFQNFAEWFEDNYNPHTMQGWHLDKDILVKGNKVYSPETCCFVPQEVNTLVIKNSVNSSGLPLGVYINGKKYFSKMNKEGKTIYLGTFKTVEETFQVYKIAKEDWIKKVADKWKPLIEPRVYQAMYNYQVEITD